MIKDCSPSVVSSLIVDSLISQNLRKYADRRRNGPKIWFSVTLLLYKICPFSSLHDRLLISNTVIEYNLSTQRDFQDSIALSHYYPVLSYPKYYTRYTLGALICRTALTPSSSVDELRGVQVVHTNVEE